jgi:hypothetical protein
MATVPNGFGPPWEGWVSGRIAGRPPKAEVLARVAPAEPSRSNEAEMDELPHRP